MKAATLLGICARVPEIIGSNWQCKTKQEMIKHSSANLIFLLFYPWINRSILGCGRTILFAKCQQGSIDTQSSGINLTFYQSLPSYTDLGLVSSHPHNKHRISTISLTIVNLI